MKSMSTEVHISRKADGGWAVQRQGAGRETSVHKTEAEAVAAGRRLALKSGGADVVVHRAGGRVRDRDTVGAAQIDARKPSVTSRAPRSEGPRTTLRVPSALAHIADRLAKELEISRNDALLRLATRGARLYEQEQRIAELRERRWAAVVPGVVDIDRADFPSPEEARAAVLAAREDVTESAG